MNDVADKPIPPDQPILADFEDLANLFRELGLVGSVEPVLLVRNVANYFVRLATHFLN